MELASILLQTRDHRNTSYLVIKSSIYWREIRTKIYFIHQKSQLSNN